jgi:hypothetical protein
MANQQLVDYINAQRAKGVGRDAINAALIGAGWNQADVSAAMDSVFPATTPGVAAVPGSMARSTAPFSTTPGASSTAGFSTGPVAFSPQPSKPVSSIGSPMGSSLPSSFSAPRTTPVTAADLSAPQEHHLSKPLIAAIIVVVLLVIGGLAYWYFGNSTPTPAAPGVASTASTGNTDQVTQANSQLQSQVTQLQAQVTNDENQLSIFAATTTKEVPLTIHGTLQQASSTKVFTLTTDRNIILVVSNSKDPKVVSALGSLVGTTVELTGTHPPVSALLKVTAVNGNLVNPPVVATSTTSTAPAATTPPAAAATTTPKTTTSTP